MTPLWPTQASDAGTLARTPSPCVAVIGCGYLGRSIAARLAARGIAVLGVNRGGTWRIDPHDDPTLHLQPAAVSMVALDLTLAPPESIANALRGTTHWVLCYSSSGGDQSRESIYLSGLALLLQAAAHAPPRRLVYTSSTSALPDLDGLLDETCSEWPTQPRGKVQRQAEEDLQRHAQATGLDCMILRLAGIYGPSRPLGRLYRNDPDQILTGDGLSPTNLIHRDDAAQAVIAALECSSPSQRLLNVCDDDHCTRREIFEALAQTMGNPPPRFEIPAAGRSVRGKRVDNQAMKRVLAVKLQFPQHLAPQR